MRLPAAVLTLAALCVLLGAAPAAATGLPVRVAKAKCGRGEAVALRGGRTTYAVTVRTRANAFREPGRGVFSAFERWNVNGVRTTFAVIAATFDRSCRPTWYRVRLPVRPNETAGWVRADAVTVRTLRTRIVVDLSDRRVTLYRGSRPLIATRAAIGTSSTPTPTGRYYVNQRLRPRDASGPFGPAAIGISAFSPVLQEWSQGGPIAIHGTNAPWLIGSAVSHGCVRVHNDAVTRLFRLAPEGTPVWIRA